MLGFACQGRADRIQHEVIVRTLDRRFRLQTPDIEIFNAIRFLACDPDVVGPPPQDVVVAIESSRNHYRITENAILINAVIGARAVVDYLHVHLFRRSIEERPDTVLLHAASLRRGGRRLLLAGSKSAGKTTFALRLMQSGYEVEGDEHVLCNRAGVVARPRACRVKASALQLLPDLAANIAAAPSYRDDDKGIIFNVDPIMLGSRWRIEPGQADLIIVLEPNHGGYSSIRPLPALAMAKSVMPETGLPENGRGAGVAAIASLARRAKSFEISLGEHASALHCVELAMNA